MLRTAATHDTQHSGCTNCETDFERFAVGFEHLEETDDERRLGRKAAGSDEN